MRWFKAAQPRREETNPEEARGSEQADQPAHRPQVALQDTAKALQVRRWNVSEGPFRGFGSQPGRF